MSTISSLRFEFLPKRTSPSCQDLIDFLDELDEVGLDISVGEFSRFVIHTDSLNLAQYFPEDFDYSNDTNIKRICELESQIGPWFEISEGLQVIQAINKEISRRCRSDEYRISSLDDLAEIAVPTLKRFKSSLGRNSGKSNRFRIEMF